MSHVTKTQLSMFQTEDLPLFSGTAQTVEVKPFVPTQSLIATQTTFNEPIKVKRPFGDCIEVFYPIGRGAYPYDCPSKDKHPDAMIYESENGGWIGDYLLQDTGLGYFTVKLPKKRS